MTSLDLVNTISVNILILVKILLLTDDRQKAPV